MQAEAEQQDQFPPPPALFELYGPSNAQQQPPPPQPILGEYDVYGIIHSTDDSLPPLVGDPLFQEADGQVLDLKQIMRKLTRELSMAYVDLLDALLLRPTKSAPSLEAMHTILRNLVHLLNRVRPIQALMGMRQQVKEDIGALQHAQQQLKQLMSTGDKLLIQQGVSHQNVDASSRPEPSGKLSGLATSEGLFA